MTEARAVTLVAAAAEALGLPASSVRERLPELLATVTRLGARWNLVGAATPEAIAREHVVEALAIGAACSAVGLQPARFVDIGAGAGVETCVLLLLWPQAQAVALEPRQRRADCIEVLADAVGVGRRLRVVRQRLAKGSALEPADLAVSRATLPLPEWLEVGADLVVPGGCLGLHHAADLPLDPLPNPAVWRRATTLAVPTRPTHAVTLVRRCTTTG